MLMICWLGMLTTTSISCLITAVCSWMMARCKGLQKKTALTPAPWPQVPPPAAPSPKHSRVPILILRGRQVPLHGQQHAGVSSHRVVQQGMGVAACQQPQVAQVGCRARQDINPRGLWVPHSHGPPRYSLQPEPSYRAAAAPCNRYFLWAPVCHLHPRSRWQPSSARRPGTHPPQGAGWRSRGCCSPVQMSKES